MSKANESLYRMVRLRRSTHADLIRIARLWQRQYEDTGAAVPASTDDRWELPSLDTIVAELIRRDDEHRARSRRVACNRKAASV